MPIFKRKSKNFFMKWSSKMAYVLGFFYADGSMFINPRGSHYVAFYSADKDILRKIRYSMGSQHHIGDRGIRSGMIKRSYVLQIGSKSMFQNLERFGLTPNKSKQLLMPKIPITYFRDFVRGYFDGDGNVTISVYSRKDRGGRAARVILAGFTSGSKKFLLQLRSHLQRYASLGKGTLYFANRGHRLYYSVHDSQKLYAFMYGGLKNKLFLLRKKKVFEKY